MTTREVAEYLNISEWQLSWWRMRGHAGGPAFVRIGRCIRYVPADVLRFVRSRREVPVAEAEKHGTTLQSARRAVRDRKS